MASLSSTVFVTEVARLQWGCLVMLGHFARYISIKEEARLAAEANQQMQSQFLSNMSHEIRTPLHGIIGMHLTPFFPIIYCFSFQSSPLWLRSVGAVGCRITKHELR